MAQADAARMHALGKHAAAAWMRNAEIVLHHRTGAADLVADQRPDLSPPARHAPRPECDIPPPHRAARSPRQAAATAQDRGGRTRRPWRLRGFCPWGAAISICDSMTTHAIIMRPGINAQIMRKKSKQVRNRSISFARRSAASLADPRKSIRGVKSIQTPARHSSSGSGCIASKGTASSLRCAPACRLRRSSACVKEIEPRWRMRTPSDCETPAQPRFRRTRMLSLRRDLTV